MERLALMIFFWTTVTFLSPPVRRAFYLTIRDLMICWMGMWHQLEAWSAHLNDASTTEMIAHCDELIARCEAKEGKSKERKDKGRRK